LLAIPSLDFSSYSDITIPSVKKTGTTEFTLELWIFLNVYTVSNIIFTEFDIYWDQHSRINLSNTINVLNIKCFPFGDSTNPSKYSEFYKEGLIVSTWTKARCGVDLFNKKFFYNSYQATLQTTAFPDYKILSSTTLKLLQPTTAIGNWGFLFLRNIKLWQSYNFKFIDTSRV